MSNKLWDLKNVVTFSNKPRVFELKAFFTVQGTGPRSAIEAFTWHKACVFCHKYGTSSVLTQPCMRWQGNLITINYHKYTKTSAVPLDVAPERRTKRWSPRFRPGGRFWTQVSDTCRQAGRREMSAPRPYETDPFHPLESILSKK